MKVCDKCQGKEKVSRVVVSSSVVQAEADLCNECRDKLPEALEGLGFTLKDQTKEPASLGRGSAGPTS